MFFDGYIGAPPTVVVFSCATAGIVNVRAGAAPLRVARSFGRLLSCEGSSAVSGGGRAILESSLRRAGVFARSVSQLGRNYRAVAAVPFITTGPVGCPVGDPVSGSTDIAKS